MQVTRLQALQAEIEAEHATSGQSERFHALCREVEHIKRCERPTVREMPATRALPIDERPTLPYIRAARRTISTLLAEVREDVLFSE